MQYTIKPGLLVSLKTRISGGVRYQTSEERTEAQGAGIVQQWRTRKEVDDVEELERASQVRSKISSLVRGACIHTPFGLLCPCDRETRLGQALTDAREMADEYNRTARFTLVQVYLLTGRIADSDAEATRAIFSDVREALDGMKAGIAEVNVEKIREAASKARALGGMLDEGAAIRVSAAVSAARKAAREIVKRVEEGKELAEVVLAEISTKPIDDLRFSFLDIDQSDRPDDGEAEPEAPAVDAQRFALLEV